MGDPAEDQIHPTAYTSDGSTGCAPSHRQDEYAVLLQVPGRPRLVQEVSRAARHGAPETTVFHRIAATRPRSQTVLALALRDGDRVADGELRRHEARALRALLSRHCGRSPKRYRERWCLAERRRILSGDPVGVQRFTTLRMASVSLRTESRRGPSHPLAASWAKLLRLRPHSRPPKSTPPPRAAENHGPERVPAGDHRVPAGITSINQVQAVLLDPGILGLSRLGATHPPKKRQR